MFADRLSVAQVMVLLDQAVEQLLFGCSPDLSQFKGAKIAQGGGNRGRAKIESGLPAFFVARGVVEDNTWRQGDTLFLLKLEQEPAADTIFEVAVGLSPIPGFTKYAGDGRATFIPMLLDDLTDKSDVVLGDCFFAEGEYHVHEKRCTRIFS